MKFNENNPASIVFDPVPSYGGDWLFSVENLRKNAIVKNGVNLFDEFYKKTYQVPLENIFKTQRILDLRVGFISKPNENNFGRCLKYSKVDFFIELTNFLNQNIDNHGLNADEKKSRIRGLISNLKKDNETLNTTYHEAFKEKARRLKDVLEKEFNSEYFEAAMIDYNYYKNVMDFATFIKSSYKITSDFQDGILRLKDFFDKEIDYNALFNVFDPDVFFLLFAKIIYEFNLKKEKETGILDNSYAYLYQYKYLLDDISKENKKYDPKILFTLSNGKKIRYSRWQFKEEFQELIERHPEAKSFKLPNLDIDDPEKYKDIKLIEKISKLYSEDTQLSWEFLPEGVGIKRDNSKKDEKTSEQKKVIIKEKDILIKETNMRIGILENSGFIGRPIRGLNTFNGYYAFIYPNGKVILEKFWDNEETLKPSINVATYVMTIDNFIELSKIPKINLIEYIRNFPENGVKRIFHTSVNNWQRNLFNEINGTYRLEDAIDFINSLKSDEVKNEK